MYQNFAEKNLLNECAKVLGISYRDMVFIFDNDVNTKKFVCNRIESGETNIIDNVGYVLNGVLGRPINDIQVISAEEMEYIRKKYGIIVECSGAKNSVVLSERKNPLVLGISGERLLRDFAKTLGITRMDAAKIVKVDTRVKEFLLKESSLTVLNSRNCLSLVLETVLGRSKGDFSKIQHDEIIKIYNKYGIAIDLGSVSRQNKAING